MTRVIVTVEDREYAGKAVGRPGADGSVYVVLDNGCQASYPPERVREDKRWPPADLEAK